MNQLTNSNSLEISGETLKELLDYSSDEIFIFNRLRQIIYANKVCEKNYGIPRDELIGRYSHELLEKKYWTPGIYPEVYKRKKPFSVIQRTNMGIELLTTAIPVLNEKNDVELLITTAREISNHKIISLNIQNERPENLESHGIVTQSPKMKRIIHLCQKAAKTDSTILIQGESGTGKGVLAKYIHQMSNRNEKPFLTINCAAIPEQLLESELFGYKRGAFTGSHPSGKTGLLEMANNGTVFLDEIGDMSLPLQAKLLQVIQDKEFIPVGGQKKKKVNVRFIAATNRNLEKQIRLGKFREDLYYRLNVIDITIPPLRDRREDIIPLIYYFLNKFNKKYSSNKLISQKCIDLLANYSWPGNVRQLANLMEKLVIISTDVIDVHDLPETFSQEKQTFVPLDDPQTLEEAINQTKRYMIRKSFEKYKSSRKVAKDLQISQTTAVRLIQQFCEDLRI